MATIIPNRAGEALQRSSENLIDLVLAAHRLNLDRQTLAQQADQFDRSLSQRVEEFQRHQDFVESGRPHSFIMDRLNNAPPGSKISELGIPQEQFQQAGLEGLDQEQVWNPETAGSLLEKMAVDSIRSGGIPDSTLERMINKIATGEATTNTLLALQDLVTETQFSVAGEKFLSLSPRDQELIAESLIGLPQSVQFQFGGQTFQFEGRDALQGALGFMNLSLAERQLTQGGNDEMLRYREALLLRMEEMGVEDFGLSQSLARTEAQRVIGGLYDDPSRIESISNPRVREFVQFQLAGRDLADKSLYQMFLQSQEGQAWRGLLEAGQDIATFLPKEEVAENLRAMTDAMAEQFGIPIGRMERRGILDRRDVISLPSTPGPQSAAPAPQIPSDLSGNPHAVAALEAGVPEDFVRASLQFLDTVPAPTTTVGGPAPSVPIPAPMSSIPPGVPPAVRARIDELNRRIAVLETGGGGTTRQQIAGELESLKSQRDSLLRAANRF